MPLLIYLCLTICIPGFGDYIGCFKDEKFDRVMVGHYEKLDAMTVEKCLEICWMKV